LGFIFSFPCFLFSRGWGKCLSVPVVSAIAPSGIGGEGSIFVRTWVEKVAGGKAIL
jgi:hypothetical protein